MSLAKNDVLDRPRPVFEQAALNRTGASSLLFAEEAQVVTQEDLHHLQVDVAAEAKALASGVISTQSGPQPRGPYDHI